MTPRWQKSSYCSEGASCIHIATTPTPPTIHLTESGDPTGAILTTTPTAFRTLLTTLKADATPPKATTPRIEVTLDKGPDTPDAPVHLHSTTAPDTVVTTDRDKWNTFVLGVRAGEFDHFTEDIARQV